MTQKQKRFAQEYVVDLNASKAARRAGYSQRTAGEIGYELLKRRDVQAEICKLMAERSERTQIRADRVLLEIGRIAFADIRKVVTWEGNDVRIVDADEISADDAATVAEISRSESKDKVNIRVRMHDKLNALEKAMKHLGMLVDKQEHAGEVNVILVDR